MTAAQYEALQETLQVILNNQKAINDNMTAFQQEMKNKFHLLDMQMELRKTHEQLADSHHDIVREEARQIKAILLKEVLPVLTPPSPTAVALDSDNDSPSQ